LCEEGHTVCAPWKKIRTRRECPRCKKNELKEQVLKVEPKQKGVRRILAIDQATHTCGWSIYDDKKLIRYGTFTTNLKDEIARDSTIKNWMLSMIENWQPDAIGLEGIQYQDEVSGQKASVTVFQALARLQGILMETCYERKIEYTVCPTNTWRHHCGVTGKTRVDKKRSM
jgi:Holliday junction resolvasome RuvABC endonuclease subunit